MFDANTEIKIRKRFSDFFEIRKAKSPKNSGLCKILEEKLGRLSLATMEERVKAAEAEVRHLNMK